MCFVVKNVIYNLMSRIIRGEGSRVDVGALTDSLNCANSEGLNQLHCRRLILNCESQ